MNKYSEYIQRAKAYLSEKLAVSDAVLELSSIRVSVELSPDAGGIYSIDMRQIVARAKGVDKGVNETDLFFGFDSKMYLSKEKDGQAGNAILFQYVDGEMFSNRPTTGQSEFSSLMSIFNGTIAFEDADGTKVMNPRPTVEWLKTPQVQYKPFRDEVKEGAKVVSIAQAEQLPQYGGEQSVSLEPMLVLSGKRETSLKLVQGTGDKSNIKGAAGSKNVFTFVIQGITARNMAERLNQVMS